VLTLLGQNPKLWKPSDVVNGRRRVDIRAWHRARQEHAAVAAERDELKAENDALKR
jgi:hypothetical protein